MTFDDGIVKILELKNVSSPGDKPRYQLSKKCEYYFSYEDVGITRFYAAKANQENLEAVIGIDYDRTIKINDYVQFEDDSIFKIIMVQHPLSENGLRYTRLSLEGKTENDISIETAKI